MAALALAVAGIAVPDSLNPTLIIAELYLAVGERPFRRTLAFTLAAFVVTLAGGLAIALGLGDLISALLPKPSSTVKWAIGTGVGVMLVCGACVLWRTRGSIAHRKPPSRVPHEHAEAGGGSALLLGGGIAGAELVTAFPYFAAIALILGASVSASSKLILLLLYNVVYVWPLIAIAVSCGVLGDRAAETLAPVGDWVARHWPLVMAPLLAAVGVALTAYGVAQLT